MNRRQGWKCNLCPPSVVEVKRENKRKHKIQERKMKKKKHPVWFPSTTSLGVCGGEKEKEYYLCRDVRTRRCTPWPLLHVSTHNHLLIANWRKEIIWISLYSKSNITIGQWGEDQIKSSWQKWPIQTIRRQKTTTNIESNTKYSNQWMTHCHSWDFKFSLYIPGQWTTSLWENKHAIGSEHSPAVFAQRQQGLPVTVAVEVLALSILIVVARLGDTRQLSHTLISQRQQQVQEHNHQHFHHMDSLCTE